VSAIAFAVYTTCCLIALAGQLAFAFREWRLLSRRDPIRIDQLYVRIERYFGLAFRAKLKEWLAGPEGELTPDRVRVVDRGHEQIRVHEKLTVPDGERIDDVVVADTLAAGTGCRFSREVYTKRHCRIGSESALQALAADGDVLLGRATRVIRWVDAAGEVMLEPGCRVLGRVTSAVRVLMTTGSMVKSAHAPVVVTINGRPASRPPYEADRLSVERVTLDEEGDGWAAAGAPKPRRQMAPECVAYDGDLKLPAVLVPTSLVVRGNLTIGPGSILRGDVKASGTIHLGAHSVCEGNIVAGRDIHLGAETSFHGVVFAEGAVRIARGVIGSRPDPGVAVYGATTVILGPDVEIHGKVSAGMHVLVAAD
jgi:hypothetical protein